MAKITTVGIDLAKKRVQRACDRRERSRAYPQDGEPRQADGDGGAVAGVRDRDGGLFRSS